MQRTTTSLWYYVGGTRKGTWTRVLCSPEEFAEKEAGLRRAGYVSVRSEEEPSARPSGERLWVATAR